MLECPNLGAGSPPAKACVGYPRAERANDETFMSMPHAPGEFPNQDLLFVKELIGRAILAEQQVAAITKQLNRVEARANSDTLNLAVLGEFNSGKSTFINALLRMPLLKSANRATTAAATRIRFGSEFLLRVEFDDGDAISAAGADCAALQSKVSRLGLSLPESTNVQQLLELVTVEPSVTAHVRYVEISLPAESLRNRLAIIDTPGIGAGVEYARSHDEVTERVAAEIAHAAVVLIPGEHPMTMTLTSFLTEKAQRFLHRCVFVITKMDHVEESDRAPLREFVAGRLGQILGSRPLVLEAAAATMLPVRQIPAHLQEAWAYWQSDFRAMEEAIHLALARNRSVIIAEHLAALLQSLLMELVTTISTRRAALETERLALEKSSVVELERVLTGLFEKCSLEIEQEVENSKAKTHQEAQNFGIRANQAARELLDGATLSSMANVLKIRVPAGINRQQEEFDEASGGHLQSLRKRCESVQRLFVEQFESSYRNLRALGLRIEVSPLPPLSGALAKGHFTTAQKFLDASGRVPKVGCALLVGYFTGVAGGVVGAFVGAAVGCSANNVEGGFWGLILGGIAGFWISAVAGGAAGARVGSNMGNLAKRRQEVLLKLRPDIEQHVKSVLAARLQDFENAKRDALNALKQGIQEHTSKYSGEVNQMRQEHHRKMARLMEQEKQVEIDSAELRQRARDLEERQQRYRTATF
jgi:GTP-binding protein EngB required for normal cell division